MFEHHAYLVEGTPTLLYEVERVMRAKGNFMDNSPDVFVQTYEKFGIDDARALCSRASMKSSSGQALYIVATASMTTEAQQALLKLFEEPQVGDVFVLVIPHGSVLPTLRSRCLIFKPSIKESEKSDARKSVDDRAREFLRLTYEGRSAIVTEIVKEYKDDRLVARDFLDALEREVYKKFNPAQTGVQLTTIEALSDIALFRGYLSDKSPSIKMIFEHLAAGLPRTI